MPLKKTTLIIKNEDTKDIRLAVELFHVNHFRCDGKLAVLLVGVSSFLLRTSGPSCGPTELFV